jgi:type I restriction enzyme, S subunit
MKQIEEIFDFVRNGASIKQADGKGGVPITRIETIWNESIDSDRFGYADISKEDLGKYEDHLLREGDILMTHINSPKHLGKSAMYGGKPELLIHGMNLLCLRPNAQISLPNYLRYYFKSVFFKIQIPKIANQSVNQASFSAGKLKQLRIPLPPLETQKKIATILDAADAYRQKTKALIEKYDELTQSLFLDMFGDPVTNPKEWDEIAMGEMLDLITYGLTVRPQYHPEGIPLISAREIRSGKVDLSSAPKISEEDFHDLSAKGKPVMGDILFSKTGSIGHCAIVEEDTHFAVTQNAARIVFKEDVDRQYAINYLRSPYIQTLSQRRAKGNAVKDLQLGDMKKFRFLLPAVDLQNKFADRAQRIEAQKVQAQDSLEKAEELFNSLLQKAFKGEVAA